MRRTDASAGELEKGGTSRGKRHPEGERWGGTRTAPSTKEGEDVGKGETCTIDETMSQGGGGGVVGGGVWWGGVG